MNIKKIKKRECRDGIYAFDVTLGDDDGETTVTVDAGHLQTYAKFQKRVLELTGKLFRDDRYEETRQRMGAQAWLDDIGYLLR